MKKTRIISRFLVWKPESETLVKMNKYCFHEKWFLFEMPHPNSSVLIKQSWLTWDLFPQGNWNFDKGLPQKILIIPLQTSKSLLVPDIVNYSDLISKLLSAKRSFELSTSTDNQNLKSNIIFWMGTAAVPFTKIHLGTWGVFMNWKRWC